MARKKRKKKKAPGSLEVKNRSAGNEAFPSSKDHAVEQSRPEPAETVDAGGEAKARERGGEHGSVRGEDRRTFLAATGKLLAGACGVAAVAGAFRLAVPEASAGKPKKFPIGKPGDFKMNTTTYLREHDLFVRRHEKGMTAMSAVCTHLGCIVQRTGTGFSCPCHGALYDGDGKVTKGPARKDLPKYKVWLHNDGRLWVDKTKEL